MSDDQHPGTDEFPAVRKTAHTFGWTIGFLAGVSVEALFAWILLAGLNAAISSDVPATYSVAFLVTLATESTREAVRSLRK
jgi:hypothetical protein